MMRVGKKKNKCWGNSLEKNQNLKMIRLKLKNLSEQVIHET